MSQNEGLSQTGLVDRTGIDRSTLADIVRRMQRKGLLQRRRTKEDARAYAVKLTDEGRRVLRTAEPLAKKVDERVLEALPTKQREQFVDDLAFHWSTRGRNVADDLTSQPCSFGERPKGLFAWFDGLFRGWACHAPCCGTCHEKKLRWQNPLVCGVLSGVVAGRDAVQEFSSAAAIRRSVIVAGLMVGFFGFMAFAQTPAARSFASGSLGVAVFLAEGTPIGAVSA